MRLKLTVIVALFIMSGCYDTNTVDKYFDTCVALKPPITLDELESRFGKVHRIDGEGEKVSLHLFLPHEDYVMHHSSFIQAEVNSDNQVVGLRCAEDKRTF